MAAKTGNDVAIVKVRSEYDNSSAKQVAKEMAASLLQVEKSVGQVDFDINTEKVSQSINEIITLINKKLKGVDFTSSLNSVLSTISNADLSIDDKVAAIDKLYEKVAKLASLDKDSRSFLATVNESDYDRILKVYDKSIGGLEQKLEKQRAKAKEKTDAFSAKTIKQLATEYADNKTYKQKTSPQFVEQFKQTLGITGDSREIKNDVKEYSRLLTLFELLTKKKEELANIKTEASAKEAIEVNKTLAALYEQITRKEAALVANYKVDDTKLTSKAADSFKGIGKNYLGQQVTQSINSYVDIAVKEIQSELSTAKKSFANEVSTFSTNNINRQSKKVEQITGKRAAKGLTGGSGDSSSDRSSISSSDSNIVEQVANATERLEKADLSKPSKDIEKYILSIDECTDKILELADANAELEEFSDDWMKNQDEQTKYFARMKSLGMSDEDLKYEFGDDLYDEISLNYANAEGSTKKQIAKIQEYKDPVLDTSQEQADVEKLEQKLDDAKQSAKELGDALDQKSSGTSDASDDVEKLKSDLIDAKSENERLENSLASSENTVRDLSGQLTDTQNEVYELEGKLEEAKSEVRELEDIIYSGMSGSSILDETSDDANKVQQEVEEATTSVKTFLDYINELYNKELKFSIDGERMTEHSALFGKHGELLDSSTGDINSSNITFDKNATTLMHSHPTNSEYNNLRFSDKDLETFFQQAVTSNLRKNVLYSGEQLLEMDLTNVPKSDLETLGKTLSNNIFEVMYKMGNATFENGTFSITETDFTKLGSEFNQEFTTLLNSLFKRTIEEYGGQLKAYTVDKQGLHETDIFTSKKYDVDEAYAIGTQASSGASLKSLESLKKGYQDLRETYNKIQDLFSSDSNIKLTDSDIVKFTEAVNRADVSLEQLEDSYLDITNKLNSGHSVESIITDLRVDEVSKRQAVATTSTTPIVQDINYSDDISDFNKMSTSIDEVTSALQKKNTEIKEEADLMSASVAEEISDLQRLELAIEDVINKLKEKNQILSKDATLFNFEDDISELKRLRDELESVFSLMNKVASRDGLGTDIQVSESTDVAETEKLKKLIDKITKSVGKKNTAFEKEEDIVKNVVESELKVLGELEEKLNSIVESLKLINKTKIKVDDGTKKDSSTKKSDSNNDDSTSTTSPTPINKPTTSSTDSKKAKINQEELNKALTRTKTILNEIKNTPVGNLPITMQRTEDAVEELNRQLNAGEISIDKYNSSIDKMALNLSQVVDEATDVNDAYAKMQQYIESTGGKDVRTVSWSPDATNKTSKLITKYTDANKKLVTVTQTFNKLDGTITRTVKTSDQAANGISKFLDGLKLKWGDVLRYFMSFGSIYEVWNVLKQGITIIRDLDDALTEMMKVSDHSLSFLREYQKESFNLANQVGTTGQQMQQSTADWLRLGESIEEAKKSAQASNVLFNVSEFESIDAATESLVAMSAAYQELDKMEINDKLNNIGNNYSIATDGIATALQKSASALTTAGNDIDEAIALITAGNAIVQNPDSVGAGIRTIALRITGTEAAKEELESLGEDTSDFIVQTSAKSQQAIKDFTKVASNNFEGFDILDANGNFKSTYEILLGISDIYDEILETDKKYGSNMANGLLETLAGKNRSNIAASILQNSELLKSVYESSQNSAGSALEENEKYMDSITGHMNELKNQWQELWSSTASRDAINFFIDFGKGILEIVDNVGLLRTAFVGVLTTLTTIKSIQGNGFFASTGSGGIKLNSNNNLFASLLNEKLSGNKISDAFSSAVNKQTIATYEELQYQMQLTGKSGLELANAMGITDKRVLAAAKSGAIATTSSEVFASSLQTVSIKSMLATAGVTALNAALTAGISLLITFGIQAIGKFIDKIIETDKEIKEAAEDARSNIDSIKSSFKDLSSTVDDIKDRYAELSQEVDQFSGKNISLSTEEYDEFLNLSNQIADLFPTLIKGYDAEGNAILDLSGNVNTVVASLDNLLEKEKEIARQDILENVPAVLKEYANSADERKDELADKTATRDSYKNIVDSYSYKKDTDYKDDTYYKISLGDSYGITPKQREIISDFIEDKIGNEYSLLSEEIDSNGQYSVLLDGIDENSIDQIESFIDYELPKKLSSLYADSVEELSTFNEKLKQDMSEYQEYLPYIIDDISSFTDKVSLDTKNNVLNLLSKSNDWITSAFEQYGNDATLDEIEAWLSDNVLDAFADNTDLQIKVSELLNTNLDPRDKLNLANEIQNIFNQEDIKIDLSFITDEDIADSTADIVERFDKVNNKLLSKHSGNSLDLREETKLLNDFFKEYSINTESEYAAWLQIASGVDTAEEAMAKYKMQLIEAVSESEGLGYNIEDVISKTTSLFKIAQDAAESANAGDTYESMYEMLETAKELYDSGDIGTDDFKSIAAMFSPSGSSDLANFKENLSTIKRYFTEDSNKGLTNFLKDLEKIDMAELDKATGNWTLSITDLEEAAVKLGIGFEPFMAILGKLEDKGFTNDFFLTEEEGMAHLVNLHGDLAQAQAELLEAEQKYGRDSTVFKEKQAEVDQLKARIENTSEALKKLSEQGPVTQEERDTAEKLTSDQMDSYESEMMSVINNKDYDDAQKGAILKRLDEQRKELLAAFKESYGYEFEFDEDGFRKKINESLKDTTIPFELEIENIADFNSLTGLDIKIDHSDVESVESDIKELYDWLEHNNFNMEIDGAEDAVDLIYQLNLEKQKLTEPSFMNIDSTQLSNLTEEEQEAVISLQELQEEWQSYQALVETKELNPNLVSDDDIAAAEEKVATFARNLKESDSLGIKINWDLEATDAEIIESLGSDKSVFNIPNLESAAEELRICEDLLKLVDTFNFSEKSIPVDIAGMESDVQNAVNRINKMTLASKSLKVYLSPNSTSGNYKLSVKPLASGTFNGFATGTVPAFAKGTDVSIPEDQVAVVNEADNEGLVRDGVLTEIPGGAHLIKLKRGDIIFNSKQMKELKKHGKVTSNGGHGKVIGNAYNDGTIPAYAGSSTGSIKGGSSSSSSKKTSSKSKSSSSDSSSAKDAASNFFYWIDRRIKKFQDNFDKWISRAEQALTKGFVDSYYKKAATQLSNLMNTQAQAYDYYLSKANSVSLSSSYKNKVKDGSISIEEITNEKTKEAIDKFQEYWDKAHDALTAFEEAANEFYNIPLESATKKIELLSDSISILEDTIDNAIGYETKNALIDQQTKQQAKILSESNIALKTAQLNLTEAGKALNTNAMLKGLSSANKTDVQNRIKAGSQVNLSLFTEGSDAWKAAVRYNEALQAVTEATNEYNSCLQETIAWEREAAKLKFDNIAEEYEHKIEMLNHGTTYLDNRIAELEARGQAVNIDYYEEQIELNNAKIEQLEKEKQALENQLDLIPEGTDEWYDAYAALQDVSSEISKCTQNTYELNKAINEAHFALFDNIHNEIDRLMDEQDFLREMMSHEKMVDENGQFTEAGYANLASLTASLYASQENEKNSKAMVDRLDAMVESGTLSDGELTFNSMEELEAAREEYYDAWREDIETTYALEQEIYNAMKEQFDAQLSSMQELINKKKEALQAEKDLYNYQKSISEKTKNISTIQKQMAAYQGDTSQEGLAKLQRLQVQLQDAEDALREAEYDKYISDQQDMLDNLYDEYEELLNKKLDDFMGVVQEGINTAEANSSIANEYLNGLQESIGYSSESGNLISATGTISSQVTNIISHLTNLETIVSGIYEAASDSDTSDITTAPEASTSGTTNSDLSQSTQNTIKADEKNVTATPGASTQSTNTSSSNSSSSSKPKVSSISATLKEGSSGSNVKTLQKALNMHQKAGLDVDGKFGPKTKAAVKKFQKNEGISSDGIVGKDTKAKFKKHGYYVGSPYIPYDQYAELNEHGPEIVWRESDGALLYPLGQGDKVFTNEMANKLWEMSKNTPIQYPNIGSVDTTALKNSINNYRSNVIGDTEIKLDAIFPGITDYSKAEDLLRAIQNNKKIQKAIQSVSIDRLNGAGRLASKGIK